MAGSSVSTVSRTRMFQGTDPELWPSWLRSRPPGLLRAAHAGGLSSSATTPITLRLRTFLKLMRSRPLPPSKGLPVPPASSGNCRLPQSTAAARPLPRPAVAASPRSEEFRGRAVAAAPARCESQPNTATVSARPPPFWTCHLRRLPPVASRDYSCQLRESHCQTAAQHFELAPRHHLSVDPQRRIRPARQMRTHDRLRTQIQQIS